MANYDRPDKLSIIIPAYLPKDQEPLVSLLAKLCKQQKDYPETEIIVIDDGCNMTWLDHIYTIRVYHFKNNRGVSAARNKGIQMSTGRYIAFVDADDDVTDDYIHTIYITMRIPGCKMAVFDTTAHNEGCPNGWDYPDIPKLAVWSYCFTRKTIGREKFNENMNVAEDVDWLRRVVPRAGDGHYEIVNKIYRYKWFHNEDSLSHRFNRGELPIYRKEDLPSAKYEKHNKKSKRRIS